MQRAVTQMRSDLERLDRVAHRFERIGREAKREPVDVSAVVERVVTYFRPRLPTLANAVVLDLEHEESGALVVPGDPVLVEWALENTTTIRDHRDQFDARGTAAG